MTYEDPNKNNAICLFDMDGTLCDYDRAMEVDLIKLRSPDESSEYGFSFNHSQPHIKERMELIKSQVGWWEFMPPLEAGFEIFRMVQELGFKVHVLTKGPYNTVSAWTEKVKWCRTNLPPEVSVTITEDKGLVYGKVLVDDYPQYITRWLENRPRGLVIMPAHEYNKHFKHPNVVRYDGSHESKMETLKRLTEAKNR